MSTLSDMDTELAALMPDDASPNGTKRRKPHPDIAGKGRKLGDLLAPLVDDGDWGCLK